MVFEENVCVRFEEVYEPSNKLLKIGLKPKDRQDPACDSSISGVVKTDDSDWQKSTLEMNRNFCGRFVLVFNNEANTNNSLLQMCRVYKKAVKP